MANGQIVAGNVNWSPEEVLGVNAAYLTIANREIHQGDCFTERDMRGAAKVCVVGVTVAQNLFHTWDCVGRVVAHLEHPAGDYRRVGEEGRDLLGRNVDNIVLVPFTTVKKRIRGSTFNNVDIILVSASSTDRMDEAADQVARCFVSDIASAPRATTISTSAPPPT